ncbi:hypothetical protein Q1695_003100 [Nippostrongylus brasiliensis]|nr:hypothetical protein Q1695_003100 [Nippostrongylus brasiliensis]
MGRSFSSLFIGGCQLPLITCRLTILQSDVVRQQERELRYQECLEICVDTAIVDSQIACNECILPIDPYNVFGTW